MTNEALTIAVVLLISAALSAAYAFVLEQLHDTYSPNWIWVTVVIGNGAIIITSAVLDGIGIALTPVRLLLLNVAWGAPIIAWQLWQWQKRRAQMRGIHAAESARRHTGD